MGLITRSNVVELYGRYTFNFVGTPKPFSKDAAIVFLLSGCVLVWELVPTTWCSHVLKYSEQWDWRDGSAVGACIGIVEDTVQFLAAALGSS